MCCYSSKSWGFFPHCILFFHLSNTELVNSVIKKEMGRNVDPVCSECTRKCRFLHGKGKSSSLLHTSFFKVMIGEDFSKYMYVPPKFYHNVSVGDLLDKQIILEDPSGEQWKVTVSFVYGSIAFKEGWSAFSFDHGLKIGDFLIFNYTSESHFDVLIYDESACNMLDFSKTRNQKKRSRGRNDSSVKDGLLVRQGLKASGVSISDLPKMKRQHREVDLGGTQHNIEKVSNYDNINATTKSVCIEDYGEDPCYMTSRGLGETERDAKTSMFDVLDCEILNNCDVNGTWKVATVDSNVCDVDCGSHACQNEAIICNKDPLYERILGKGAASDPSELKLSRCNHSLGQKDNSAYDKNCTLKLKENSENNSIMSNRKVRECQFAEGLESEQMVISQKRYASQIGSFYNTNGVLDGIPKISDTIRKGQMSKEIKKEHVDMTPSVYKYKDELPATGKLRRGAASDPYKFVLTGRNNSLGLKDKSAYVNKCNTKLEENRENISIMSNRKVRESQFAEGLGHMSQSIKKEIVDKMTPNMYKDELLTTGQTSERFKSELQDTTPFVYKDNLLLATGSSKVIKREPGQSLQPFNEDNESHSQTAATVSCDVPTDIDTFLELPAPLPLSNKRGIKMKRLVVYLRDELMNLWPVFYHEQSNFYALTEGWSEYRKANNIQPRDLCIFGAENESNRIIAVNIVHK
ncbi:PREDICTED: B3 domain-containing protein Os02g0598200-like isoform X2 [Lupinus angustifolius]|uniref:B3 domain-containing protein Os02g0598200-like isoform X2 n=1 Tax=Lupinus angustifolius TaxID=3871 RepID=UPI00092F9E55|nr:PREDICTED: B3 domain-containing protein Os02g0598200-like isoform X2 [Lupinus angustifolius]